MTTNNPFSPDPSPNGLAASDLTRSDAARLSQTPLTVLARTLSALPVRPADVTARAVADLIAAVLQARRFARVGEARQALATLHPLTSRLILLHDVEAGGITLDMEDARLDIGFEYAGTRLLPVTLPPALEALGAMSAETVLTLTFVLTRPLRDAHPHALAERVNASGALRVAFRALNALPPYPARGEDGAENPDNGEGDPASTEGYNNDNADADDAQDGAGGTTDKGELR